MAYLQKPIRHLILTLAHPNSVAAGEVDDLHPAVKNVTEIDLGGGALRVNQRKNADGSYVIVIGKLCHAHTVHHLRDIMMTVTSISTTKKNG